MLKSISTKQTKIILLSITAIFIMAAVFFSTVYYLNRGDASVQGVRVGPHEVGRMNEDTIRNILLEKIAEQDSAPLVLKADTGAEIHMLPSELEVTRDVDSTVQSVISYGKEGPLFYRLLQQSKALFAGVEIPLYVAVSEEEYTDFIENNLSDIHKPAKNAGYIYNEDIDGFEFTPAQTGVVVNDETFRADVSRNLKRLTSDTIHIQRHADEPLVSSVEDTIAAREDAEDIIANLPYTIQSRATHWEIEKEDIISWLEFVPEKKEGVDDYELKVDFSEKEIADYLTRFAPGLNVPAKDARFTMKNGRVDAFSLAENGYELDVEKSAQAIKEAVLNKEKEASLAFTEIEPKITNESVDNLGIRSLVGRGESDFKGSPSSRRHNIRVGSDKFQGLLIAPGEVFSFNRNLGPVTAAAGYLPELVIKNNKTIPEYGGGLCQVSTTLFRAAVYGGLEITERFNHSYPVVYYGTPGFDATIYPMHPDLQFKNNTDGHLLIQYEITGTKLIFEIYGKDDGRRTEVDGPHLYDKQPSGAVKAWLKQTVYNESGNVMHEKTFYSNYKSPALYPVTRNPLE